MGSSKTFGSSTEPASMLQASIKAFKLVLQNPFEEQSFSLVPEFLINPRPLLPLLPPLRGGISAAWNLAFRIGSMDGFGMFYHSSFSLKRVRLSRGEQQLVLWY
ncbi:unnamed protein product [Orchesella dallaii]|uniref:Uncharacterized protein n=1 Tax=Orchesella dallaii TaxID=48710 RepID=A0ABP1QXY9_9HEXA